MGFILGQERILHLRENGTTTWYPVACLTSNELSENTDFLDTTTRVNQGHRTSIPTEQSYDISFNAIMPDDAGVVGKYGLKELRQLKLNQTFMDWKLEALNSNFTDYGQCYIGDLSESAAVDGFIEFSGSLIGYGKYFDLTDTEAPTAPILSLLIDTNEPSLNPGWTLSTDNLAVTGYELRKSISNQPEQIIDVGNVNSYSDTSIQYFQYYSYNVRAYDAAGNYSSWSNKVLGYVPLPVGQPTPEYLQLENGNTILAESGVPLIEE